jgi:excisionase family DNA binding protein
MSVSDSEILGLQRLAASRGRTTGELVEWLADALERAAPVSERPDASWSEAEAAVLDEEGVDTASLRPDETDVVANGAQRYLQMLADGLSVSEAANAIGVTDSRIRQLLSQRRLYGVRPRGRAWVIPRWQFADGSVLPGIETVNRVIPDNCHPLVVSGFLHTPQPELAVSGDDGPALSPLEWLRRGGSTEPVVALAQSL